MKAEFVLDKNERCGVMGEGLSVVGSVLEWGERVGISRRDRLRRYYREWLGGHIMNIYRDMKTSSFEKIY